jgi:hypothetical protein
MPRTRSRRAAPSRTEDGATGSASAQAPPDREDRQGPQPSRTTAATDRDPVTDEVVDALIEEDRETLEELAKQ